MLGAVAGALATAAVGASLIEEKRDEAVSQPANPNASELTHSANAMGFVLCQAAAVSKVVTLTLPR
jgi:hypothetical protein